MTTIQTLMRIRAGFCRRFVLADPQRDKESPGYAGLQGDAYERHLGIKVRLCGPLSGGSDRSSGANTAPRTATVVSGASWRPTTLETISARAGSMGRDLLRWKRVR